MGAPPTKARRTTLPSIKASLSISFWPVRGRQETDRLICSADEERGMVKRKGRDRMSGNYKMRKGQGQGKRGRHNKRQGSMA
jgi:hypothetical protein